MSSKNITLFGDKFIALNLINLLRCPKCRCEYSDKYEKRAAGQAKCFRPFLLACGHSMCENCIHLSRQRLICAVCNCQLSPMKTSKRRSSRWNYNSCNFFNINFYMLGGMLNTYHNSRNNMDGNTPSIGSKHHTAAQAVNVQFKCSECDRLTADGECRKCDAYYCKSCFDALHLHSKVLKVHTFHKLGARNKNNCIKVAEESFHMPQQTYCAKHDKLEKFYCTECCRTSCPTCAQSLHKSHEVCLLQEENKNFMLDISNVLEAVLSSHESVRNFQMLIKNGESKLEDYATQTLTDISTYFLQLHGLLQLEELRITESLRSKSLRPQMKLRNAAQQLNAYESDLLKMRHNLDSYKLKLPHDVHLKEVFMHYYNYLEKIPSELQFSLGTNPFVFEALAEDKLMQIIKSHIRHDYIDPKAEGQRTESWHSCSKCMLPETPHAALHSSVPPSTATPQAESQQHSFTCESPKLCESSASDASDTICITHVNSPESFYVRTARSSKRMHELSDKCLRNAAAMRVVRHKSIRIGHKYLIYHQPAKFWYRAEIKQAIKPDAFNVFLIDLGIHMKANASGIYKLGCKAAQMSPGAMHCCLHDIKPAADNWADAANHLLLELTCNRPVRLRYARRAGSNFYNIDLATDNYGSQISVRDALLYSGLALERSGNVLPQAAAITRFQGIAALHQRMPKRSFLPGEQLDVATTTIKNPDEFYVVQHELKDELDGVSAQLNEFFNTSVDGSWEHIYVGAIDMACAVSVNDTWYRASIREILRAGKVVVQLVDQGRKYPAYWRELYVLPAQFLITKFAFKCALADVEPLQNNNYTWTAKSIAEFRQLAFNPKLQVKIVITSGDTHNVALHVVRKRDELLNIGATLVKLGHATSTGVCSVLPYKKRKDEQMLDAHCNLSIEPVLASLPTDCREASYVDSSIEHSDNIPECNSVKTQVPPLRTPVLITHVVDHSEFYVRFTSMQKEFRVFENRLQNYANDKRKTSRHLEKLWEEHELCLVNACLDQIHTTPTSKWYRGLVAAVEHAGSKYTTYNVFLFDYGITIEGITAGLLLESTSELDETANGAQRCHLAGLIAPDSDVAWFMFSKNYFKSLLCADSRQTYEINSVDCNSYSISVILWSVNLAVGDPLGPATRRCENINKCIAKAGLAISMQPVGKKVELSDGKANFQLKNHLFDSLLNKTMSITEDVQQPPANSHASELEEQLNQLDDAACTLTKVLPDAWLRQRPQNQTRFTAKPTYVDVNAVIYVQLPADLHFVNKMKDKLRQIYAPIFKSRRHIHDVFVNEQPCVIFYKRNKTYYRGIVQSHNQSQNTYRVCFIDYGNMKHVGAKCLIPYAPLPTVHSMALPLRIDGIEPKLDAEGLGYSAQTLDAMHTKLVDKLVSVTVREEIPTGTKIRKCDIHISSISIADILVQLDYAIRKKPTKKFTKRAHCGPAAEARPEAREEVINFYRNMQSGDSLELSPPTKRLMYTLSKTEVEEEGQDSQVQELSSTAIDVSVDIDDDDDDDGGGNNIQATVNLDNDCKTVSKDSELYESFVIQEQVRNRFYLQLEDKIDFDQFCPLETSTVFSLFDGVEHFKPQKLPTGIIEFKCSIDRIVSTTELQIFPHVKELRRRDIAMRRKIAQLIKDTPSLNNCEPNTLCLACYTRDRKWYRAIVRSFNSYQSTAVVLYIDYLNSEQLPLCKLKRMPMELLAWPLRSLRVKLHNIKPNPHIRQYEARKALQRCILKPAVLYAFVTRMPDYGSSLSDDDSISCNPETLCGPADKATHIVTVELYEHASSTVPIYQTLLDKKQYINEDDST